MADVIIDSAGVLANASAMRTTVWTTDLIGYTFYTDSDGDFFFKKTTDGGATWGSQTEIDSDTTITCVAFDVWFDKWTPGDTGTLIHIVWFDTENDDVMYKQLQTTTDTLQGQVIIEAETSAVAGVGTYCSITKARGGNLFVVWELDASAERGFERSTNGGATWAARTNPQEALGDYAMLFPGSAADANDITMIYLDISTNALTIKVHDDSANSNSESGTVATLVESTTNGTQQYPFKGAIRHSDNHLIMAVFIGTIDNVTLSGFRVYDINGTGSITQLTNIIADGAVDDCYYPSVYVDQFDNIYVGYIGLRDGSQTLDATTGVYYVKSTDDGATWSAGDTTYSETSSDWRQTWAAPNGPRWYITWRDVSSQELRGNFVNSVVAAAPEVDTSGECEADGEIEAVLQKESDASGECEAEGDLEAQLQKVSSVSGEIEAEGEIEAGSIKVGIVSGECEAEGEIEAASIKVAIVSGECEAEGETEGATQKIGSSAAECEADGDTEAQLQKIGNVTAECEADGDTEAQLQKVSSVSGECEAEGETEGDVVRVFFTSGECEADGELEAAIQKVGIVSGECEADGETEATSIKVGIVSGECEAEGEIEAASIKVGLVSGECEAEGEIEAQLQRIASVTGECEAEGDLEAQLQKVSSVSGECEADGALEAALQKVGIVSGECEAEGDLEGVAAQFQQGDVSGECEADGETEARLQKIGNTSGAVDGDGETTAEIQKVSSVSGECEAEWEIEAASIKVGLASGECEAEGETEAQLQKIGIVSGECEAEGDIEGNAAPDSPDVAGECEADGEIEAATQKVVGAAGECEAEGEIEGDATRVVLTFGQCIGIGMLVARLHKHGRSGGVCEGVGTMDHATKGVNAITRIYIGMGRDPELPALSDFLRAHVDRGRTQL